LADGCWDHDFGGYYYESPDWDAFACPSLPLPCDAVHVDFQWTDGSGGVPQPDPKLMTADDIASAEAATRCVIENLRDRTPGRFMIEWREVGGEYDIITNYFVLPDGVVVSISALEDLGASAEEAFRALRDPTYFDECLTRTELGPLVQCIAVGPEWGGISGIPAIDPDACVNAEPACPDG
jgi:hypothetical protein